MTTPVLLVIAIFLCLLGNGFFSGSEIAILSMRRSRVEQLIAEGSRGARWVKHLQDNMDRFLATVQIGVTLMGTLAGVIGGYLGSTLGPVPAILIGGAGFAVFSLTSLLTPLRAARA